VTFAEGILKWSGFLQLNDTAILLVGDEFKLRLPDGPYSFPAPALIAFASGSVEVLAPVFLVLGLGTRFAGLVLLVMTCIVELTVPEGWPVHITWAAMALSIMTWGPGRFSPSLVHVGRAMGRPAPLRVQQFRSLEVASQPRYTGKDVDAIVGVLQE
jgi:putative oxidoreductase